MAGRIKHMERSHRSHRRDTFIFSNFERRAYHVNRLKKQRQTLGQKFAELLAPLRNAMKRTAEK